MKNSLFFFIFFLSLSAFAQQKTVQQIKAELEGAENPPLYAKDVLKKKFRMDTVTVASNRQFQGIEDSLAFHGKLRKVYGPYKGRVLLQVLATIPATFNHLHQIFLDTSVLLHRFADSLANDIISRINSGVSSFEDMAQSYSMGGEAATKGDLGWLSSAAMLPKMAKAIQQSKKGALVKVWTGSGLHIIRKTGNPVEGPGYALMMRVFL